MIDRIARTLPRQQVETPARSLEAHDRPSANARSEVLGAVPTGAFADLASRLFEAWAASADAVRGPRLAPYLRAVLVGMLREAER